LLNFKVSSPFVVSINYFSGLYLIFVSLIRLVWLLFFLYVRVKACYSSLISLVQLVDICIIQGIRFELRSSYLFTLRVEFQVIRLLNKKKACYSNLVVELNIVLGVVFIYCFLQATYLLCKFVANLKISL
jgi:hypothetical protein